MPERQISASKVRRIQIFTGPFFPPFTSNVGQEMVPASHRVELNKEPKCEEVVFFWHVIHRRWQGRWPSLVLSGDGTTCSHVQAKVGQGDDTTW